MRLGLAIGALALLGLAACGGGERATISKLDRTMMIFIEPPARSGDQADATVHYVFAEPQALEGGKHIAVMEYRSTFDCASRRVADRAKIYALADGQRLSEEAGSPAFEPIKLGTVRDGIWKAVCDPVTARQHRAPDANLAAAEARYRKMLADGKL